MVDLTVAIGPSSFGKASSVPTEMLHTAGVTIKPNPYGRKLEEDEIIEHLRGVDGLIAGLEPLNETVLTGSPQLKAIARVGIGMDNVDSDAAARLGIKVSNTPDGPTEAVAEMTLAALLTIGRGIILANQALHSGEWKKEIGFGLSGLQVLIIGFGRIGRLVCSHLQHFKAEISVVDPYIDAADLPDGVRKVSLKEGLLSAEVISLHVSGTDEVLGENEFSRMKKGTILLNSARGTVINEAALIKALDAGIIKGGWTDVFPVEPYTGELLRYPQMILTPHLCSYSRQCRLSMETEAVSNLLRDLGCK